METNIHNQVNNDEVSLNVLFKTLWGGRWLILSVTLACTLSAVLAAWLLPKKYEAIVVMAAASTSSSGPQAGGLSSLASQFGGIASLAGISVGGDSKKSEAIAVLQSEALTERYIQTNNLLPVLYRSDWDSQKMKWNKTDPEKIPTLWKANQYFKKKIRVVTADPKTGLVSLTITWRNPVTAAQWANDLVKMTNDYLRDKAITESERNIAYLNNEAAKTNIVEARQAIYSILQAEINKVMLARGNEEYAFKILDPATASEKPTSPQPLIWFFGGLAGGLFLGSFAALARSTLKSPRT